MEISVIVPVYNVEKFVAKCVESLLDQDFSGDYEVILVNDGSSDGSYEICKNFADKNEKIVLLSQENQGVSSARNKGLDAARGKYVCFADSDDYVEKDFLSTLYDAATREGVQLGMCGFTFIEENKKTEYFLDGFFRGRDKVFNAIFNNSRGWEPFNKIFSLEIINKNNLRFSPKLKIAEDKDFSFRYCSYVENAFASPAQVYNYVSRNGSATRPLDSKSYERQLYLCEESIKSDNNMLEFNNINKVGQEKIVWYHLVREELFYILHCVRNEKKLTPKCVEYRRFIREHLFSFLTHKNPPTTKILAICVAVNWRLAVALSNAKRFVKKMLGRK